MTTIPARKIRNNILTASRMGAMMKCLRSAYWSYEVGLRKTETSLALRIGSAWARAMEARWNGLDYDAALSKALPEGLEMDEQSCATIAALLLAYYRLYGASEGSGKIHAEVQFKFPIDHGFTAEGKMDGLGTLSDGRMALIEGKTTSASIEPDSDYWLRLAFNMQLYQYILAARELDWDVSTVLYDVTRKPTIKPKQVNDLDEAGMKIVLDAAGNRVLKKNGEPKQSAGEGETLQCHIETPDEFSARLLEDISLRPDFYFVRKEVPILEDNLEAFKLQRDAISRLIISLRANEQGLERKENAWPRNVSEMTCNFCSYQSFCLQNLTVDVKHPPEGFKIEGFNPELEKQNETN